MAGEYYRIGVSIAMSSNGSQVLGALSRELLGLNAHTKTLEGSLDRIKIAALGFGAAMGGTAILGGMAKLVEHGKEFVHQQSLMAQAGMSQVDIATATGAAWKNASKILNAGASDNLKLLADLRNEFGNIGDAVRASPAFTKLGVVAAQVTGQNPEQAGYEASRFLDLRGSLVDPKTGQISEARAEQQARLLEAITAATVGRVGSSELLNFQKQARGAGASLTDAGLVNMVPVIQAMGGYRTGTSLTSMQQEILGGRLTQQAGLFLEKAGVLDSSKVSVRRGGQLVVGAGGVRDAGLLATDPVKYIDTVVRAGLVGMGAKTPEQQTVLLMRDGLRQTVNGLITEVIRNAVPFSRDAGNISRAASVDQYEVMAKTDPSVKMQAFTTSWNNLLTALGAPIVTDATGALTKITNALNGLALWTSAHPRLVGEIEEVVAALGGLAVLGGSLAVTGAALGPLVGGLKAFTIFMAGPEVLLVGTTLGSVAAGIAALGAALIGLPPLLNYLAREFGPTNDTKPNSANRGHAGAVTIAPPAVHTFSARGNYHPTSYEPVPASLPIQHINLLVDGKKMAEVVTGHQSRSMRPNVQTGTSGPDWLQTPLPVGMSPSLI